MMGLITKPEAGGAAPLSDEREPPRTGLTENAMNSRVMGGIGWRIRRCAVGELKPLPPRSG